METIGTVRTIAQADAELYRDFITQLDRESKFLLFESGERNDSTEFYQRLIDTSLSDANVAWFVAEHERRIIGFLSAVRGQQRRIRHRAYIVLGVLAECHRQGVATRLFDRLFGWAGEQDVERIELTVVAENAAAIALYTQMGFKIEGLRRRSLRIDGEWVDEYAMAKLMRPDSAE